MNKFCHIKDKDPFWEPAETPVMIGVVSLPLNYLSHMLDFSDEPLTVLDYQAKQCGFLQVGDSTHFDVHPNSS